MTEKEDVKVNIQANDCVDGIIILLSSGLYESIKKDKTFLKQIFDTIVKDIEIDNK